MAPPRHRQTITGHLMSMSFSPASSEAIFSVVPPLVNVAAAHIVDADFDDMVMAALPRAAAAAVAAKRTVLGAAAAVDAAMGDIEPTPTHFSIGPPLSTAAPPPPGPKMRPRGVLTRLGRKYFSTKFVILI